MLLLSFLAAKAKRANIMNSMLFIAQSKNTYKRGEEAFPSVLVFVESTEGPRQGKQGLAGLCRG